MHRTINIKIFLSSSNVSTTLPIKTAVTLHVKKGSLKLIFQWAVLLCQCISSFLGLSSNRTTVSDFIHHLEIFQTQHFRNQTHCHHPI